jgi:hypothetical protein
MLFSAFFSRGHILRVFYLCFVPVLFSSLLLLFPCVCLYLFALSLLFVFVVIGIL